MAREKKLVNGFTLNLFLRLGWWSVIAVTVMHGVSEMFPVIPDAGDGLKQRMTHFSIMEPSSLGLSHLPTDFLQDFGSCCTQTANTTRTLPSTTTHVRTGLGLSGEFMRRSFPALPRGSWGKCPSGKRRLKRLTCETPESQPQWWECCHC